MGDDLIEPSSFEVISHDMHGDPVRCSYCTRPVKKVVVMPLPSVHEVANSNSDDAWLGVCAYCVLAMAKALQAAEADGSG